TAPGPDAAAHAQRAPELDRRARPARRDRREAALTAAPGLLPARVRGVLPGREKGTAAASCLLLGDAVTRAALEGRRHHSGTQTGGEPDGHKKSRASDRQRSQGQGPGGPGPGAAIGPFHLEPCRGPPGPG